MTDSYIAEVTVQRLTEWLEQHSALDTNDPQVLKVIRAVVYADQEMREAERRAIHERNVAELREYQIEKARASQEHAETLRRYREETPWHRRVFRLGPQPPSILLTSGPDHWKTYKAMRARGDLPSQQ